MKWSDWYPARCAYCQRGYLASGIACYRCHGRGYVWQRVTVPASPPVLGTAADGGLLAERDAVRGAR